MTRSLDEQIHQIQQAIAAQENLREILGDAVVEATLAALHKQLAELEAQARLTEPQRKLVTVLFADLSGFTSMAEAMDAEDLNELMNALWARLDKAIVDHGGTVDKHMGDAVMALWGAETAREDDPERAIRAALTMQEEIDGFGAQLSDLTARLKIQNPLSELEMRIGINTGPVVLGGVGTTGEFSAMGGAVNLAKRLERAAPIGGVLISHHTYRQVRGVFDVLSQEPIQVKGKSEPVRVYVVEKAKARAFRMGTRGIEGIETRMVGRDAEMQRLQTLFWDATENPHTHLVTVVGEAGVGKSRLLYEFDNWIELLSQPVYYFKGRATPATQAVPYGLIRAVFAHRFEIFETDSAAVAMDKFRAGMAGILEPEKADLVGHLVGFDFSKSRAVQNLLGGASFGQMAAAYLTAYVRHMASEPTAVFLEDIHWSDDRSLDLIEHLVAQIPEAHLLIVCLTRPPLFERRPDWAGSSSLCHTCLELDPLSQQDSRALVAQILQKAEAVPDSLRDLVVDGAEGNPFYLEELIKMLIEDGVIVRDDQRWDVEPERLTSVRVPSTLTGVLQARLDSLPRPEKMILQRASVVGRLFWDAALSELVASDPREMSEAEVDALLDDLCSRELVYPRKESAFAGTNEFIFKHAILHNVTYETVLLKLRRIYHAQVARWLEAHAGERIGEYLALIAQHYELAGEMIQAADYLRRAGEEAYRVCAYHDAIRTFERALALLPDEGAQIRSALLLAQGLAYRRLGRYESSTRCFQETLTLAQATGDKRLEVRSLNGLGWAAMGPGTYNEAVPILEQALALARKLGDQEEMATALYNLGDVAYRQGDAEAAKRYAQESLAICQELGHRQSMASALRVLGFAAMMRGEHEQALDYHAQSQAVFREIGDQWGVNAGFINLGETVRQQGRYREAVEYLEEALPISRELGTRRSEAIALLNLGSVYAEMEEAEPAWRYLGESLEAALAIGSLAAALEGVVAVALLLTQADQPEPAAELVGLVQAHSALNAEIAKYVAPVLDRLRQALPADRLEAALERGASLELNAVVGDLPAYRVAQRD